MSSALLSDLKAALQDLCCELQEEYHAGQHIAQQFAEAKEAWTVECTQLRSLVSRERDQNTSKLAYLESCFFLIIKKNDCFLIRKTFEPTFLILLYVSGIQE